MNTHARTFEARPAVRSEVPLLVGIFGPSGSGKTYSALRLASGIRDVTGGEIFGIDTEARRMAHYADFFKFQHLDFKAPFGSLDYLAAIQHCVAKGAKVVIVDSMSHEHSGPGGYLLTQEAELDRLAGEDQQRRDRAKFSAWVKPAALRGQMVTGILQLNINLISCFRGKEKIKPIKGAGVKELGWMPIAGDELLYEQTVNCLLLPKANGVPTWRSDQIGEKQMMKLPKQFEGIFAQQQPLSEGIGRQLAEWARGDKVSAPAAQPTNGNATEGDAEFGDGETETDRLMRHEAALAEAAGKGMAELKSAWSAIPPADRKTLKSALETRFKAIAAEADLRAGAAV